MGNGSAEACLKRGARPVGPGSEPGTHSGEDTRAVKPFEPISQPDAARGTIRTGRASRRHVDDVALRGSGRPRRCPRSMLRLGRQWRADRLAGGFRRAIEWTDRCTELDPQHRRRHRAQDGPDRRDPALRRGRRVRDARLYRGPGAGVHPLRRRDAHLPADQGRTSPGGRLGRAFPARSGPRR